MDFCGPDFAYLPLGMSMVILPGCLALSYVAQRLKNTWPAIIAHGLENGLLEVIVVIL